MSFLGKLWLKFVLAYLLGLAALVALAVVMLLQKPSAGMAILWIALPVLWLLAYPPLMAWREWRKMKRILREFREKPPEPDRAVRFFAELGARQTGLPQWLLVRLLQKGGARLIGEIRTRLKP